MKLSTSPNIKSICKPKPKDRFTFIVDERMKLVIPIGPRFQVDVPSWTHPLTRTDRAINDIELDNSKWICTPTWLGKGTSQDTDNNAIGRGRPNICECAFPRSIECVRKHVSDKRSQLRIDLGPAFWNWKFDNMGEDVSKLWNQDEEKIFNHVVKANPTSQGRSFMKCALELLSCQSRVNIVNYYLNVYIPRRISVQTRSNRTSVIDSDADDNEDVPRIKGSRKRCQANNLVSGNPTKYIKTKYLMARR